MKTLKLDKAWDFITPQVTVAYPAGSHEVSNEAFAAAVKAGVTQEEEDGGRTAKTGSKDDTDSAKK